MIENEIQFNEKVKRYAEIHSIVDKYTKELETIKSELKPYMQEKALKKVTHEGKDLELIAQDRSKIDSEKLLNVLKNRLSHFELDLFKVQKEINGIQLTSIMYKNAEELVRVEMNGEVFSDLQTAREYLMEHFSFTEEQALDAFSSATPIPASDKYDLWNSIKKCIEIKEIPNEDAVKEAVSLGSLTMSDIADATIVNITYALMMKKPKSGPKSEK
jgi:hypothetical protein